jgi:hypothetical protein
MVNKKKPKHSRPVNTTSQSSPQSPLGQLTKILDTTTERKKGLRHLYQFVVDTQNVITGIDDESRKSIFGHMLTISKKLAKVADAVDQYEKIEEEELKRIVEEAKKNNSVTAEESTRLEAIAEEVLSQSKSTLDVTVKILKPLVGIDLHTYGKSGLDVIKSLKNNIPKDLKDKAENLIDLIEKDKQWIDVFKKYRDDQHYGNLGISTIRADKQGRFDVPLMPDGTPVRQYMDILYENIFSYVMDFVALAIFLRMLKGFTLSVDGEGRDRVYKLAIDSTAMENSTSN